MFAFVFVFLSIYLSMLHTYTLKLVHFSNTNLFANSADLHKLAAVIFPLATVVSELTPPHANQCST